MSEAAWAERKARQVIETIQGGGYPSTKAPAVIADALLAEHRRAVRAVKREIVATEKLRDTALRVDNVAAEAVYLDTIVALNKVLAALQKGRT